MHSDPGVGGIELATELVAHRDVIQQRGFWLIGGVNEFLLIEDKVHRVAVVEYHGHGVAMREQKVYADADGGSVCLSFRDYRWPILKVDRTEATVRGANLQIRAGIASDAHVDALQVKVCAVLPLRLP